MKSFGLILLSFLILLISVGCEGTLAGIRDPKTSETVAENRTFTEEDLPYTKPQDASEPDKAEPKDPFLRELPGYDLREIPSRLPVYEILPYTSEEQQRIVKEVLRKGVFPANQMHVMSQEGDPNYRFTVTPLVEGFSIEQLKAMFSVKEAVAFAVPDSDISYWYVKGKNLEEDLFNQEYRRLSDKPAGKDQRELSIALPKTRILGDYQTIEYEEAMKALLSGNTLQRPAESLTTDGILGYEVTYLMSSGGYAFPVYRFLVKNQDGVYSFQHVLAVQL